MLKITLSLLAGFVALGWFFWARNQASKSDITDLKRENYKTQKNIALVLSIIFFVLAIYLIFSEKKFRYKMDTSGGRPPVVGHEDIAEDISRRECDTKKRFLNTLVRKRDDCFASSGRVSDVDYPLSYEKTYLKDYSSLINDLPCDGLDSDVFPSLAAELKTCQTPYEDPCAVKVKKATLPLYDSIRTLEEVNKDLQGTVTDLLRSRAPSPNLRYSPTNFEEFDE